MKTLSLKMSFVVLLGFSFFAGPARAEKRSVASTREKPTLTYDLGASTGSYNGYSYNEIYLGLNWYTQDWLNWRNSVFTRFGTNIDTITGLDSALLLTGDAYTQGRGLGIEGFIGPGVRLADHDNSAVFGEAGVAFAVAGLHLGIGAKSLYYTTNRVDKSGADLPKNDTQYFIILSGGGIL